MLLWRLVVAGGGGVAGGCAVVSRRWRVARMRRVAREALGACPLADPQLRFAADGENTTFGVDARAPGGGERFVLRVHRLARHGRGVDTAAAVASELCWLGALRAGAGLAVPEPFRTTTGDLTTTVASSLLPGPRVCSVLGWMAGRIHAVAPAPVHLRRLGAVMARLHEHAARWRPRPAWFGSAGTGRHSPATP